MVIRFLPGQPNSGDHTVFTTVWENRRILLYCSGNNLIILQDSTILLQTIYIDSDCNAVSMESGKGLIAVSYDTNVLVFEPTVYLDERPPKWNYFTCLKGDPKDGKIVSLNWGESFRELVTGSKRLCFWSIDVENNRDHSLCWSKLLANPASNLVFSPDSYLVASVYARYEQLVKIWRRSSFDPDSLTFDFTYLPHPTPVHRIWWKKSAFKDQLVRNTLYTLAEDGILRIWAAVDNSDPGNLQLWGSIDCECAENLIMMFDNTIISKTIESLVSENGIDEKLSAVAAENADFCLIITSQQVLIYTIENSGILHQEKLLKIEKFACFKTLHYVGEFRSFRPADSTKGVMPFILDPVQSSPRGELLAFIHDLHSACIDDISISLTDILSPKNGYEINICLHNVLTGQSKSIQSIIRASDGLSLFSQSRFSENFVWMPRRLVDGGITLSRSSFIQTGSSTVIRAVLGPRGYFVLTFLDNGTLKLYDCRQSTAVEAASIEVTGTTNPPLCALLLPESDSTNHIHLIAVYDWQNIQVWSVELDLSGAGTNLVHLGKFPLPLDNFTDELHLAVPVDPVGWKFTVGNELDTFAREVLTTVSKQGIIRNWTSAIVENHTLQWLEKSTADTERINVTKVSVSSNDKAAIADESATELTIWDTRHGILEFQQQGEDQDTIADLDWTTTTADECVLGVGYRQVVVLYCQQRFDYTNDTPSWAAFRKVDISRYTTHDIGDSIWLSNGGFAVGAGNQLFIQDEKVNINDSLTSQLLGSRNTQMAVGNSDSIFDICSIMNGPLPLYHPQLLIQLVFAGKLELVKSLLLTLLEKLKFAPVIEPSMVFELDSNIGLDDGCTSRIFSTPDETQFSRDTAADLIQRLQKYSLPYLTRHQQITLVSVIESVAQIMQDIRSLDENAIKYLLGFNLYQLHRGLQAKMTIRDFNWALHSESDTILLDIVTRRSPKPLLWPTVRDVGIPYWLKTEQLRDQFEILAKNYFNEDGRRDPVKCSLYYLALKKKQVLVGLWKIASWNKEQPKTIKLLLNDFNSPRWRSAALKNAYALLGKHRYEYAAAFFLLGDSLKDAVNVILRNMNDLALAIAVCRVYENGNSGPILKYIIETHVLGQNKKDSWLVSWGLWILNKKQEATEVLIGQRYKAYDTAHSSGYSTPITADQLSYSRPYLSDDPVLVQLYKYLRPKVSTDQPPTNLSNLEMRFLLKVTAIYTRMGCGLIVLDLLKNWRFAATKVTEEKPQTNTIVEKIQDLNKHPAAVFEEPDMGAFNFGF